MTSTTTGVTLAALLAAVVTAAYCAPAPSSDTTLTTTPAEKICVTNIALVEPPRWHFPCGVVAKSGDRAVRHGNKALLNKVKTQFGIAQGLLDRVLAPTINQLYIAVEPFKTETWLQFEHFEWYKKNVRNLQMKQKAIRVFQQMHVSMQTMMATIEYLLFMEHLGTHLNPRKKLFIDIDNQVKTILCEAEDALLLMNATLPEKVSRDVVQWPLPTNCTSDTEIKLKDYGVLDRLKHSVDNWLQVLKDTLATRPKKGRGKNRGKGKGNNAKVNKNNNKRRTANRLRRKQTAQH